MLELSGVVYIGVSHVSGAAGEDERDSPSWDAHWFYHQASSEEKNDTDGKYCAAVPHLSQLMHF